MKKTTDLSGTSKGYKVFSVAILVVMVIFFLFPLYWIVTGSFKNKLEITARTPIWFPIEPTVENYARLFDNPAFLWLFNIIFISAAAMILTCLTASLAGYALGKKRFIGRGGSTAGPSCLPSSSAPWLCPNRSLLSLWLRR